MPAFDPAQMAWLSAHHSVVSRSQLLDLGMSRSQISRRLADGQLVRIHQSVFIFGGSPATELSAAVAACCVGPEVMISHFTAGRLWSLRHLGADRRLHVSIKGPDHLRFRGAVVHRTHRVDASDVVSRPDGVRLTSPARTVFDLAALLPAKSIESIVEQVIHEEMCSLNDLQSIVERLGERGRNGTARIRAVLGHRAAASPAVASDLELRFERAVVLAGLEKPIRQPAIGVGEMVIHPDFYWPSSRFVVEIDHVTWHGGKYDRTYDNRRDRGLRSIGIEVRRITDHEVINEIETVLVDVAHSLTERRRKPGDPTII